MILEPIAWLRKVDAGTDNECLVIACKGDPGAIPVYGSAAPPVPEGEIDYLEVSLRDLSTAITKGLPDDIPNYADWPVNLPAGHWRALAGLALA